MKDIFGSIRNVVFNRKKKNPNELRTIRILKSNLNIGKDKKINNYSSNSIKTSRVTLKILKFFNF
jgi:hypothetical protein